jgi:hypothetical protein
MSLLFFLNALEKYRLRIKVKISSNIPTGNTSRASHNT